MTQSFFHGVIGMPSEKTNKNLRAFIFAEGGAPRLRPLTDHVPTCLLPVGGIPLLDRQIQALLKAGVKDITVVGGYRAAQVEQACRFYSAVGFRFNPRFNRVQPTLNALRASGPLGKDPVLLICGELLMDRSLLDCVLDGKSDTVLAEGRRSVGLYFLRPGTAQALQEAGEDALNHGEAESGLFSFLEDFLSGRKHKVVEPKEPWARLNSMEELARALKTHPTPPQVPVAAPAETPPPVPPAGVPARAVLGAPETAIENDSGPSGAPSDSREGERALPPLLKVFHQ